MNVAGPSRRVNPLGGTARERVESTYEQDLLGLLDQLGLDELDEMETFFTHRAGAGERMSDHDVAMNDLLQQARAMAAFNEDRILAERIAAGDEVGLEFQRPPRVEAPRVAVPQPNVHRTQTQQNQNRQPARNRTVPSQTWGGWLISVVDRVLGFKPTPPASATNTNNVTIATSRTPVANRPTGHDCVICQDPIHGVEIRAPCGHYYDVGCITDLFQSATRDETLYPPRCCRQNIPFAQVRPHISQVLVTAFQDKEAEFSTLKRVYCSSPACSRFLGPLSEAMFASKVYTCLAPNCGRRTCGKCRGEHTGEWTHVCRPDADAAQVLEISRAAGWARCPGCSQMIELNIGCFHMTCRCRTEFCYLCLARWKTCQCPQWDERRLLAAAEERVDARLGVDRVMPAQRARPAPAPAAPVFVPARNPYAPVARPVPPIPPRPAPVPVLAAVPAQPVAQAPALRPLPTPVRATPTASSSILRPTTTPAPTVARTLTNPFMSPSATASARLPLASPAPTANQPSRNPFISPPTISASSASTSASATASTSNSASASTPSPTSEPHWPKAAVGNTDPTRQRLVREMMERLRVDHECEHKRWRYRNGAGICQHCGQYLPKYLFRCQGCETMACNRCRRNRL